MIVCGQAAHIWVCRTCTVSIFQHGIFSNRITNYGVVIALLLGCFVTYCPGKIPVLYCTVLYCTVLYCTVLSFVTTGGLTCFHPTTKSALYFISNLSFASIFLCCFPSTPFHFSHFSCNFNTTFLTLSGLQTIVQSANPDSLLILYASLFVSFALW